MDKGAPVLQSRILLHINNCHVWSYSASVTSESEFISSLFGHLFIKARERSVVDNQAAVKELKETIGLI